MFKRGRKPRGLQLVSAQITKVDGENRITFTLDGVVHQGVPYLFGYQPIVFELVHVLVRPDGSLFVLGTSYSAPAES